MFSAIPSPLSPSISRSERTESGSTCDTSVSDDDISGRRRSKTHSICFADEAPGGKGELAHIRYVESFKEHNKAFNYEPEVPVASEFINRQRRYRRAPRNISRIMTMPYTSPSFRGRELSLELASSCAWNRV